MLVSLEWLSELVDIKGLKPEEIGEALTMSGLEVEEVEYIKPKFSKVYTAKIEEIEQHPEADKIRLVSVNYGKETQKVVCGAKNIEVGQKIAFAVEGAEVFNRKDGTQFKLKKTKIRGVESSGMICSESELGLESNLFPDGILVLSDMDRFKGKEIELGTPLEQLLEIKEDAVLHTAPTANRGDQMSMRGIANEVASIFNRPIKMPEIKVEENSLKANDKFEIKIEDLDTCKYYALGLLKDVKIKPSPDWMARRLENSGMRSISNIVDITNYVMLEYGQPLHAFDYAKVPEKSIIVRRAKEGEKITTLDSIERELNPDNVLIATPERPVALAGVMGDETSEIGDTTTDIALESAFFTSATNRKNSRAIGIRTEACARFERGVDIKSVKTALKRAMQLLVELADAKTAGIFEDGKVDLDPVIIELRFSQVTRVLGIEVPKDKCIEILKNLDFELIEENQEKGIAKFKVPTYRTQDVYREIDVIEEIARIYGYDKIPESIPRKSHVPELPEEELLSRKIKSILKGSGLTEVVTSSLTGYPLLKWCGIPNDENTTVKVTNPQSDEYTMLRQSMVPGILQLVKLNIDRDRKDIWVFDIGKTYHIDIEREVTKTDSTCEERLVLAGAITGDTLQGGWHTQNKVDFYVLKGLVENLLDSLGFAGRISYEASSDVDHLHPGRSAYIDILGKPKSIDKNKYPFVGTMGQVHPEKVSSCKLGQEVFVFEIDLTQLIKCVPKSVAKFKKLPQYPAVVRDIAFIVEDTVSHAEVAQIIKKSGNCLLKKAEIFDHYKGEHVPEGKKSLAFHLTLQDVNSTLTDDSVEKEMNNIRNGLAKAFEVAFR